MLPRYVWYIKDEDTDIVATVLIDSSGEAAGVGVLNSTTVYFTDTSGALWTIDNTGFEATEILSYDEYDMTGEPSGMVLWEHTAQIFWQKRLPWPSASAASSARPRRPEPIDT